MRYRLVSAYYVIEVTRDGSMSRWDVRPCESCEEAIYLLSFPPKYPLFSDSMSSPRLVYVPNFPRGLCGDKAMTCGRVRAIIHDGTSAPSHHIVQQLLWRDTKFAFVKSFSFILFLVVYLGWAECLSQGAWVDYNNGEWSIEGISRLKKMPFPVFRSPSSTFFVSRLGY